MQVLVVDDIATLGDAAAVRQLAQKGTVLVASAAGRSLNDLLQSPELGYLVGGTAPMFGGTPAR